MRKYSSLTFLMYSGSGDRVFMIPHPMKTEPPMTTDIFNQTPRLTIIAASSSRLEEEIDTRHGKRRTKVSYITLHNTLAPVNPSTARDVVVGVCVR